MTVERAALQELIRDLGELPPAVRRELRPALRNASQPALARVRANASWSMRIPSAVSLSTSFGRTPGVTIRVSSARAPEARPLEHDGQPGMFRHPVFGHRDRWVSQPARPFFYSSVEATADQIADQIADAVMDVARQHGF